MFLQYIRQMTTKLVMKEFLTNVGIGLEHHSLNRKTICRKISSQYRYNTSIFIDHMMRVQYLVQSGLLNSIGTKKLPFKIGKENK